MANQNFDRTTMRLSATSALVGQLLYVVVTLFHTGGVANNHPAIFLSYAHSASWTAVHVAQFACMAILFASLFALFFALDIQTGTARWVCRFGTASTAAAFALYGGVLAVDGVALKQAVNAWANAPEIEKASRLAAAESIRWLEWGFRSYENFALGLAVFLLAIATALARLPRPIAFLMGLSGLTYLAQGWLAGSEGFSPAHTIAIVSAEVLNAAWMIWLSILAWKARRSFDER